FRCREGLIMRRETGIGIIVGGVAACLVLQAIWTHWVNPTNSPGQGTARRETTATESPVLVSSANHVATEGAATTLTPAGFGGQAAGGAHPFITKAVGKPGGRFVDAAIADPKTFNILLANETSSTA